MPAGLIIAVVIIAILAHVVLRCIVRVVRWGLWLCILAIGVAVVIALMAGL